jgi:hypothetical protein
MLNLIKKLKEVKEFRKNKGKRHPLWLILLIIILGTMQGYLGYRALGGLAKSNVKEICETFGIVTFRVPSFSCIRRVMLGVDWENLLEIFNQWAEGEYKDILDILWLALDGKSLRNTVINANDAEQNFVKIVSIFSQETGLVLPLKQIENKTGSEIAAVQDTIFCQKIRGHWGIENILHWVRDVIFKEDDSPIKDFKAATNMSILLTIGMNLLRSSGFLSITDGQRWLDRKWNRLMILLA